MKRSILKYQDLQYISPVAELLPDAEVAAPLGWRWDGLNAEHTFCRIQWWQYRALSSNTKSCLKSIKLLQTHFRNTPKDIMDKGAPTVVCRSTYFLSHEHFENCLQLELFLISLRQGSEQASCSLFSWPLTPHPDKSYLQSGHDLRGHQLPSTWQMFGINDCSIFDPDE